MPEDRSPSLDDRQIRDAVERGLGEISASADTEVVDRLVGLVILLAQWAPRMNLTGHHDPMAIVSRLVLDAAALAGRLPELRAARSLADLGSGAGFPGLPIAILSPWLSVYLVESREKRHHFQRAARRQLGLEGVVPIHGRSDAVEIRACDVVIAQAMTQPAEAIRAMLPWARPGGLLVLPASEGSEPPQLDPGSLPIALPLERRDYRVPIAGLSRSLWVARVANP